MILDLLNALNALHPWAYGAAEVLLIAAVAYPLIGLAFPPPKRVGCERCGHAEEKVSDLAVIEEQRPGSESGKES